MSSNSSNRVSNKKASGRPTGSKTTNPNAKKTGPRGPRQPKLGPPQRVSPWAQLEEAEVGGGSRREGDQDGDHHASSGEESTAITPATAPPGLRAGFLTQDRGANPAPVNPAPAAPAVPTAPTSVPPTPQTPPSTAMGAANPAPVNPAPVNPAPAVPTAPTSVPPTPQTPPSTAMGAANPAPVNPAPAAPAVPTSVPPTPQTPPSTAMGAAVPAPVPILSPPLPPPPPPPPPPLPHVVHAVSPSEELQDIAPGRAMDKFISKVKKTVDGIITRVGHGSKKQGVRGTLDRGSPWFYPDDPLLAAVPDLETHWLTPVFVCIWELLDKSIKAPPCPRCQSSEHVVSQGWDPQSRTVHAEHFNYHIISKQYTCKCCKQKAIASKGKGKKIGDLGYKFSAWHPGVLKQLPRDLAELFPAVILRRSAIDTKLLTRIEQTLVNPIGLKTLEQHLAECHKKYFMTMQIRYYARMDRRRRQNNLSLVPRENELLKNPPRFGSFSDENGYNGRPPSAAVMKSAFVAVMEGREHWYHRQQQLVDGTNLAIDESHKVVKAIRVGNEKVFHGVCTVINEYGQVVLQVGVATLGEIAPHLKALANRYLTQGFPLIQVVWTDMCCGDRSIIQDTLSASSVSVNDRASPKCFSEGDGPLLPLLDFPNQASPILLPVTNEDCEHCARNCVMLLRRARESKPAVLGFDIEWSVRQSRSRPQVALVQLSALDGYTVLFHLKSDERRPGIMPKALKELLMNNTVQLAGVSVRSDLTHLFNSYGIQGSMPVDVGVLAGKHLGVKIGARSLQALTAALLRRRLPKGSVRTGNWETRLTPEQVKYAGLDSYAGVVLFYHVWARMDPIFTEPRPDVLSLASNTTLRLYTGTNSHFVAEATLEDFPRTGFWGNTGLQIGRVGGGATRMVVKLTVIHRGGARAIHPSKDGGEPQALDELKVGAVVLWDAVNSRLPKKAPSTLACSLPESVEMAELASSSNVEGVSVSSGVDGVSSSSGSKKPLVKLDLWHGENRVISCASKKHGAYRPFCAALRDALAVADPEVVGRVKKVWKERNPSLDEKQVMEDMREKFSSHVVKYVPRVVPPPEISLPRYDNVIDTFKRVRDGATGQTLFTDRMDKAAANLRSHIEKGCVHDPDPDIVPLFRLSGRTKDGLDIVRSLKGTNRVENYHQPLRLLMGSYHTSPMMAHYTMLLHNYRRNHRMAGLYRGMDPDLLGYYSHWEVEDIQAITKGWYDDEPLFPGWESTKNFRDTGELAGFVTSRDPEEARKELERMSDVFPGADEDVSGGGGESDGEEEVRCGVPKERWGTIDGLTPNERFYARLQGAAAGERMTTAVQTQAEKEKFDREVYQFLITPERREQLGGHPAIQAIDFNRFAEKWNKDVGETEENEAAGRLEPTQDASRKINRKLPHDLSLRWTESKRDINTERTVEQSKTLLSAMHRRNRVHIASPSTSERAAIGATQSGLRFSFPFLSTGEEPLPRPAAMSITAAGNAKDDGRESMSDESSVDVGEDDIGRFHEDSDDVDGTSSRASKRRAIDEGAGGAGASGAQGRDEGGGGVDKGKGAFVVPPVACSSLHSVAPTFGLGYGLVAAHQVWHPMPPTQLPTAATSSRPPRVISCRDCGHNPRVGRWVNMHSGGGRYGEKVCSVPGDLRRVPDHPRNRKHPFNRCECNDCRPA